jgi:GntR family transcriptional regulator
MRSVEENDPRPPSVQIADHLRTLIADGQMAPGTRLPSGRALAKEFGVALMTAQAAVQRLRDEGLVISASRGYFVTEGGPTETADAPYELLAKDVAAMKAEVRKLAKRVADLEDGSR